MSKGYTDNVDEYAYDYLYEMFKKYHSTETLREQMPGAFKEDDSSGDIMVETKESMKWWDAIIYFKRRDEALTKLVETLELDESDFAYFPKRENELEEDEYYIFSMPVSKEDFEFIKGMCLR